MAFLQLFLVVGTTCLLALKAYLLRARHRRLDNPELICSRSITIKP